MPAYTKIQDIARETLRQLAASQQPPTPDNYRRLYHRVAGTDDAETTQSATAWARLVRDAAHQYGQAHAELTPEQKREALENAIACADAGKIFQGLKTLVATWSALPAARGKAPEAQNSLPQELRELLAHVLERGVAGSLAAAPELADDARALAQSARVARDRAALAALATKLRNLWYRVELRGSDNERVQRGVLHLLQLLIENVQELAGEDRWLHGQLAIVMQVLSGPLTPAVVGEAERTLKQVVFKQGVIKHSLEDAKTAVKQMVSTFILRLGELSSSTGDYHDRIGTLATKIRQTEDVGQLGALVTQVMDQTRTMQVNMVRSRDALLTAQQQVESAEQRIRDLEAELAQVSGMIREDQLTGALNRRGLEEAFDRELAVGERHPRPLSVALLDVDNFKQLNDTHGHQAGDEALVHLAQLIRRTIRPADVLARYGGEEFLILMPDADVEYAVAAMRRLQRELTRHFFLHERQKLLITFSAGVTACKAGEGRNDLVARADKALYQAKQEGKNRVAAL